MADSASWRVTALASFVAIFSSATVARAQPVTTNSASQSASPAAGAISGTVTNAAGGAPIQSVVVQVYGSNGVMVASPSTDPSGVYTASGLAPGSYFAKTLNTQSYVEQLFSGKTCIGGLCSVTTGTPIVVTDGATTTNINFALTLGGIITGTVRAAVGNTPINALNLFAYTSSGVFIPGVNATNASGVYTLPPLPPGNYFLITSSQGFRDQPVLNYVDTLYPNITCPAATCSFASGTLIGVSAGVTTSGINFSLAGGGVITGAITAGGASVDSARATIYNASGAAVAYYFYPTASGSYSVPGLPTGNYFAVGSKFGYVNQLFNNISCPANSCGVTTGTPIAVTAGATTPNINFALLASGTITGTVTNASGGATLSGIAAQIYNSSGMLVTTTGKTSVSGIYTAFGLSTGDYFVKTSNTVGFIDQLYNGIPCAPSCTVTAGTHVSVTGGSSTPNINFALTAQSVPFTDDPLTPGTLIKAVHITELRTRIDAVRAHYALAAYGYTRPSITAGTSVIMAEDIIQMRQALLAAYTAAARLPPTYSTSPGAGVTISVADIAELRAAVVAIE